MGGMSETGWDQYRVAATGWRRGWPMGLGKTKPKHFRDMLRVVWRNRDNLSYAWKVITRGVCDGCALGVAGRGCEAFRERYGIPDEGWGRDVHFPGWVDQADLPVFYREAELFLYPSNMEAHPIPITEALATGTPIVTSNAYGLKELAGDAALLVDPSDPKAIAAAVLQLVSDPKLREQLKGRAAERSKLFDWDVCAERTLAILERVAAKG